MTEDELVAAKADRLELLERMFFPEDGMLKDACQAQFDGGAVRNALAIATLLENIIHQRSVILLPDGSLDNEMGKAFMGFANAAWRAAIDLAILLGSMPPFGDAEESPEAYNRLKLIREIDNGAAE